MNAGTLVARYVDCCRELNGHPPPDSVKGRFAKVAAKHVDRYPDGVLIAATEILVERGLSPSLFGDCIQQAFAVERKATRKTETAAIREVFDGGWPTGARFVRGSHSGSYVYDPLGRDKPPSQWEHSYPRREEVLAALKDAA
jgi:hypothetical protein